MHPTVTHTITLLIVDMAMNPVLDSVVILQNELRKFRSITKIAKRIIDIGGMNALKRRRMMCDHHNVFRLNFRLNDRIVNEFNRNLMKGNRILRTKTAGSKIDDSIVVHFLFQMPLTKRVILTNVRPECGAHEFNALVFDTLILQDTNISVFSNRLFSLLS